MRRSETRTAEFDKTPRFTRNHDTWIPMHRTVMVTPRYSISELHIGKFPDPDDFQCWRINFKTEVCVSTSTPQLTVSWINEVEIATSIQDLMTSQSISGEFFPDSEMLDGRITSALRKIISSTSFKRRVSVEEQRAQKIQLQGDDVQDFDTRWDQILLGTNEMPPENVLEGLYKHKLQGSE